MMFETSPWQGSCLLVRTIVLILLFIRAACAWVCVLCVCMRVRALYIRTRALWNLGWGQRTTFKSQFSPCKNETQVISVLLSTKPSPLPHPHPPHSLPRWSLNFASSCFPLPSAGIAAWDSVTGSEMLDIKHRTSCLVGQAELHSSPANLKFNKKFERYLGVPSSL